jgi:hypothetical protein
MTCKSAKGVGYPAMRAWALALLAGTAACSPSGQPSTSPADATAATACGPAAGAACTCESGATSSCASEPACPDGGSTTISGTIYDPANVNPLYNVAVYVPSVPVPLPALPEGVSCGSCTSLLTAPRAAATTDEMGRFTIRNAPDGRNLPLVVQIGKWRMVYTIASVVACQDNPQPDHSLRLPRSHSEGNLPDIAISTGGADSMECLPLRMGVDAAEYVGGAAGPGRIHIPWLRRPRSRRVPLPRHPAACGVNGDVRARGLQRPAREPRARGRSEPGLPRSHGRRRRSRRLLEPSSDAPGEGVRVPVLRHVVLPGSDTAAPAADA